MRVAHKKGINVLYANGGAHYVDVDIYASVLSCCEFFFPRLNPGGVMVFDDYGLITCAGAWDAGKRMYQQRLVVDSAPM